MICKQSKIFLWLSTIIWSIITLTISFLILIKHQIDIHFSFEMWIELSKAIAFWYVLAILCAYIIDLIKRKKQ